jgi:transposase
MRPRKANSVEVLIDAVVRGDVDEGQALRLCRESPELVTLALLAAGKRIAKLEGQSQAHASSCATPSGMIPVYTKPNTQTRHKRPGAKRGHRGARRARPERIDKQCAHRLKHCPDCGGRLQRCRRTRTRIIEDIPEEIHTEVTEHTIHRDYCPRCKQHVEPVVPDAFPHATMGHRLVCLTAWWHYGLGVTIDQIVEIVNYHLQTWITPGGLVSMWQRLAEALEPWYIQIGESARRSAVLHADETGWRVNGQTNWLWCFANDQVCYYMIDRTRGSPVLEKFFTDTFEGVLVTDFYAAYNAVCAEERQCCLVHLLRELHAVDERNDSRVWQSFSRRLKRLIRDGIRLRRRQDFSPQKYAHRIHRIHRRLMTLALGKYEDADASRLGNRLCRHSDELFTFLDRPDAAWENNLAERMIRPAVVLRKNSQSNRSERGAAVQGLLMSVYRTLKLRNLNPTNTIARALRTYVTTQKLPPLPTASSANG